MLYIYQWVSSSERAILTLFSVIKSFTKNKERNQMTTTYDYRLLQISYVIKHKAKRTFWKNQGTGNDIDIRNIYDFYDFAEK